MESVGVTHKAYRAGTHRVCSPVETFERIEPVFDRVGITRLADITGLDEIGIPVYQAIRPDARSLSVSQGKGLSSDLAKVSAAMEAIELWHAERIPRERRVPAVVGDVVGQLPYRLDELNLSVRNHLNATTILEWTDAWTFGSDRTAVPTDLLDLDSRVRPYWKPKAFESSSNGLASGNTIEEAQLHGLYEVVEREAIAAHAGRVSSTLALDTVDGAAADLVERFRLAGVDVEVHVLQTAFRVPCFRARIWSDVFPVLFGGSGCHLDREVALCRALTEAAQSRAGAIAGARDDLTDYHFKRARDVPLNGAVSPELDQDTRRTHSLSYDEIATEWYDDIADDLAAMVNRVTAYLGREPLFVDHTRPDLDVPVVHVICPGLRHRTTRR
jgi:YcaO-like protein with predicted kinase domain